MVGQARKRLTLGTLDSPSEIRSFVLSCLYFDQGMGKESGISVIDLNWILASCELCVIDVVWNPPVGRVFKGEAA